MKIPPTQLGYGAPPEDLGVLPLPTWQEFMHFMYLPVVIDSDFYLPGRLGFAFPLLERAIEAEAARGNDWPYVYVTARRGYATPGNPLNRPGWHTDGFGGPDINYVWTDRWPTLFAVGDFWDISPDHVDSVRQFRDQILSVDPTDRAARIALRTYPDASLLRLDQRVVHAAPEIPAPGGVRSFFKVSFSADRYNLLGNSHNYGLSYDWPMYDRDALRNDPTRAGLDSVNP